MKTKPSRAAILEGLALLLILISSTTLSAASLTDGDQWGDFAGYFVQAKSLLEGDPASAVERMAELNRLSDVAPGPDAYPWGYPVLVAATAWRFGFEPLAIKAMNPAFYALFLLCLHLFARQKVRPILALLVTGVFAFSPISLSLNDHMRSDSAFLFLFTLALLVNESARRKPNLGRYAGLGLVIFFASLFRTVGVTLLVLPFSALTIQPKLPRKQALGWVMVSLVVFAVGTAAYRILLPNGEGSYLSHFAFLNIEVFYQSLWTSFITPKMLVSSAPLDWVVYLLLLVSFLIGALRFGRRDMEIFALFSGYLAVITIWPQPQGYRFFAPVMPIFILYAAAGLQNLPGFKWSGILAAALLLLISAFNLPVVTQTALTTLDRDRVISGPFDRHARDMFRWIAKNTELDDRVHFEKPRSVLFFGDRDAFNAGNCEQLSAGSIALFSDQLAERAEFSEEMFLACADYSPRLIYENERFRLYRYAGE